MWASSPLWSSSTASARNAPPRPDEAFDILKREMVEMLSVDDTGHPLDVDARPLVLLVVGVNGVGKTTGIAKLTNLYLQDGRQVLIGAADTFRAGAAEQLRTWGRRLDVDVISHREGADPGAVAFDTVSAALSRNADVVIVDTAGRLHTKTNLMEELKKIRRVVSRHVPESSIRVLLALDAVTGQNGLHQARAFTQALKCHGVLLSKLDGTAKGGIVLAITRELGIPVLYIGTGEQPDDIAAFDPQQFVDALFETEWYPLSLDGLTRVGIQLLPHFESNPSTVILNAAKRSEESKMSVPRQRRHGEFLVPSARMRMARRLTRPAVMDFNASLRSE